MNLLFSSSSSSIGRSVPWTRSAAALLHGSSLSISAGASVIYFEEVSTVLEEEKEEVLPWKRVEDLGLNFPPKALPQAPCRGEWRRTRSGCSLTYHQKQLQSKKRILKYIIICAVSLWNISPGMFVVVISCCCRCYLSVFVCLFVYIVYLSLLVIWVYCTVSRIVVCLVLS